MSIKSQTIPFWRKSVANAMPIQSRFMSIKRQSDVPGPLILQARQAAWGHKAFEGAHLILSRQMSWLCFFGKHLSIWLNCAPSKHWGGTFEDFAKHLT
jgi:hypothetical protein